MDKIQQAYEMGLRIRYKGWDITFWIKKHSETEVIDESGFVWDGGWAFDNNPEKWEIFPEDAHLFNPKTDTIVQAVQADLQARSERGIAKYGTTLDRTDLTQKEWLQHAYEEALDFALYLKKLINHDN
jgi:hypothetical protein